MKIKKLMSLCAVLLSFSMLCGCWSNIEIYELAFIMGIGIDKAEGDYEYTITAQVAKPSAMKTSFSEGGDEEAYVNITETGKGVEAALNLLKTQLDRRLYAKQNQLVVISEEAAKSDILPILDSLMRTMNGRFSENIYIAEGEAKELLTIKGDLEDIPSNYLVKLVDSKFGYFEMPVTTVRNFMSDMLSKTAAAVIPTIGIIEDVEGEPRANITGIAVFKNGEMCMTLDREQAKSFLMLREKADGEFVQIDIFDSFMGLNIIQSELETKPVFSGDTLEKIVVTMNLGFAISETTADVDLLSEDVRHQIEEVLSKHIKDGLQNTFEYTQLYSTDIFGFGELLYHYHPKKTKELTDNWDEAYKNLKVEFDVKTTVLSTGAILHPLIHQHENEMK